MVWASVGIAVVCGLLLIVVMAFFIRTRVAGPMGAVGVGTNTFANPLTMLEVLDGVEAFMKRKGYASVYDMCGIAHER